MLSDLHKKVWLLWMPAAECSWLHHDWAFATAELSFQFLVQRTKHGSWQYYLIWHVVLQFFRSLRCESFDMAKVANVSAATNELTAFQDAFNHDYVRVLVSSKEWVHVLDWMFRSRQESLVVEGGENGDGTIWWWSYCGRYSMIKADWISNWNPFATHRRRTIFEQRVAWKIDIRTLQNGHSLNHPSQGRNKSVC